MTSTAFTPPAAMPVTMNPKRQFLDQFEREHQTTLRVLRAYPADKADLKPSEKSKSAIGLAAVFIAEMGMAQVALTTGFDWTKPMPASPAPPPTLEGVIAAFDHMHAAIVQLVNDTPDDQLFNTIKFPSGPGTISDITKIEFLWFLLSDQIHHRGQFSVYLRIAGAKVPSIYGPTLDEPWM